MATQAPQWKTTEALQPGEKVWMGNYELLCISTVTSARSERRGQLAFYVTAVGVHSGEDHIFWATNQTRWLLHDEK